MASLFTRFLDHTQRRATVGRTPLGEWSARRRHLYLTIHSTHNRQTSMPPVGFFFNCSIFVRFVYFLFNCPYCPIILRAVDFSIMKNPTASVGSEPAILGRIRTHDHGRRTAVDLRLRLRGHWDRRYNTSYDHELWGIRFLNPRSGSESFKDFSVTTAAVRTTAAPTVATRKSNITETIVA
jgi:hypothetical protein